MLVCFNRIFNRRKITLALIFMVLGVFSAGIVIDKGISLIFSLPLIFWALLLIRAIKLSKINLVIYFLGMAVMLGSTWIANNVPDEFDYGLVTEVNVYEDSLRVVCKGLNGQSRSQFRESFAPKISLYVYLTKETNQESDKSADLDDKDITRVDLIRNPEYYDLIGAYIDLGPEITNLSTPDGAGNPRTFDYRKYLRGRNIYKVGYVDSPEKLNPVGYNGNPFFTFKRILLKLRDGYLYTCFVDDEDRQMAKGILFGITKDMSEDMEESFRGTGTAHILAVSGLHIGMMYSLYRRIYNRRKKSWITATFIVFLLVYGTMCLWSSSVLRAIGLIFIKLYGNRRRRRYDLLTSASLINLCILTFRPYMLYDTGCQMSFLAAYGIAVISPRLRGKLPDALTAPLVVQLFLFPYMLKEFNQIALGGLLANLIIIQLVSYYVYLGIGGFLLYGMGIPQFGLISKVVAYLGMVMRWVVDHIYGGGKTAMTVISPRAVTVILVMSIIIIICSESLLLAFHRYLWKNFLVLLICLLPMVFALVWADSTPFDRATQVFVDVGQGDSLHIRWRNQGGRARIFFGHEDLDMLIDGGGRYNYNIGEEVLRPYLLHNGVKNIDLALTTHEHMDHYKGIEELMESYEVRKYINKGVAGDIIYIDENHYIEILWPLEEMADSDDENYYSRIYLIHDGELKTLVTGDITAEGEDALLNKYRGTDKLKCHVLKVAHHGSKYSSTEDFIAACDPIIAVISVGRNNYGHPSKDAIENLEDRGIIVYRTDLDGAVGVWESQGKIEVCSQKTHKKDIYEIR